MDRESARALIASVIRKDGHLDMTSHFTEQCSERNYSFGDAVYVLRKGEIESGPAWKPEHQNHQVEVLGRCLDGRLTRVAVGLRQVGASTLITIIKVARGRKRRRKR